MMEPLREQLPGHPAVRVLVVDDDVSIREMFVDLLGEMGYLTEAVATGKEAVGKIEKEEFDLILLDLVLPEMSGQDTFELIREIDPEIPVIIVTGYGSIENAVEFLKNGAADYLAKPVHFEELKFRVNRALEEKRLKQQTITDLKTQLFNHSYFEKRLKEEIGRAKRYGHHISLLMIDLDDFKQFNDTYGHLAGDRVLREVGAILKSAVRDCDIPCRFGGEEFSIILPETESKGAFKVAERMRRSIESGKLCDQAPMGEKMVTASIGVASCGPIDNGICKYELDSLIERADEQLYKAKRQGKNRICVAEELITDVSIA